MKKTLILILIGMITLAGCKKFVTADFPPNQLTIDKVFSDTTSVVAATKNMYTLFATIDNNLVRYLGLYTDELKSSTASGVIAEFSNGSLTPVNTTVLSVWQNLYASIYKANGIIEGVTASSDLPIGIKNRALGEAKFVRGYCYLLLSELWGDVPLVLSTDAAKNSLMARSPVSAVQNQIISDLSDAAALLPVNYPEGTDITPNKYAALGYLAKAALQKGDYMLAESSTSTIINSTSYQLLSNLNNVETVNNTEALFQLWNLQGFSPLTSAVTSGVPATQITTQLLSSFEANDQRKVSWVGSDKVGTVQYFFPYKFKQKSATSGSVAEYTTYLRLAEIYLIRSEARAYQKDETGATNDLNVIRVRAGLPKLNLSLRDDVLNALLQERRIELFNEGGNRFIDLNRFGKTDLTLSPLKSLWKPTAKLFPIPQSEILTDPNLTQNAGY